MTSNRLHKLTEDLVRATRAPAVRLEFTDGVTVDGAIVFNPKGGTGRCINIDTEDSVAFVVDQVSAVRLASPAAV